MLLKFAQICKSEMMIIMGKEQDRESFIRLAKDEGFKVEILKFKKAIEAKKIVSSMSSLVLNNRH